jgi:hypothetical protein
VPGTVGTPGTNLAQRWLLHKIDQKKPFLTLKKGQKMMFLHEKKESFFSKKKSLPCWEIRY